MKWRTKTKEKVKGKSLETSKHGKIYSIEMNNSVKKRMELLNEGGSRGGSLKNQNGLTPYTHRSFVLSSKYSIIVIILKNK